MKYRAILTIEADPEKSRYPVKIRDVRKWISSFAKATENFTGAKVEVVTVDAEPEP